MRPGRSAPAGAPGADGANQPPNLTSNRRLQQTQAQVDEVGLGRAGESPGLALFNHIIIII